MKFQPKTLNFYMVLDLMYINIIQHTNFDLRIPLTTLVLKYINNFFKLCDEYYLSKTYSIHSSLSLFV
jgi:hypothetical protein